MTKQQVDRSIADEMRLLIESGFLALFAFLVVITAYWYVDSKRDVLALYERRLWVEDIKPGDPIRIYQTYIKRVDCPGSGAVFAHKIDNGAQYQLRSFGMTWPVTREPLSTISSYQSFEPLPPGQYLLRIVLAYQCNPIFANLQRLSELHFTVKEPHG